MVAYTLVCNYFHSLNDGSEISSVLSFHAHRLDSLIVGLNVEWRPSYSRYKNPVATLQLCVGTRCLLFQLIHSDSIPSQLSSFLSDHRFKFVGVGVDEDVEKLVGDCGMSVANPVDLRAVAAEVYGRREMHMQQMGIVKLADEVLGMEVRKPKKITMSRWDQEYLTLDQIGYACVDAFLSFEIGRRLIAG
ncbi:Werner Syndrome-like exonuclease [Asparagus officinalis]|uniref:Werner Syndrome-like exonuclease n=1 Tax=Asparagus officinalis TaxID=4686 RepID=UPI00098DED31|nr:Werner Syndrome-like exonuclease [Asparagus officinalis]